MAVVFKRARSLAWFNKSKKQPAKTVRRKPKKKIKPHEPEPVPVPVLPREVETRPPPVSQKKHVPMPNVHRKRFGLRTRKIL